MIPLMKGAKHHAGLFAIAGAFLLLGTIYSVVDPVFESSDEFWHYPYVKHIADGKGLPVQGRPTPYAYRQEGSQPPLYYALAALTTFWIDTGPPEEVWDLNPHAQIGRPAATDNKNVVIHGPDEGFPYHGVYLAVHIIRLLGVMMGAGTVALTYALARETVPKNKAIALGAAALVAFNPMFLFISASVNNDTLATLLSTLALLMLVRTLKQEPKAPALMLSGAVLAAGAITKLNTLILYPLTLVALAFLACRRRSFAFLLRSGLWIVVPAIVLAGWWYARNWLLYGEPTGLSSMLDIVEARNHSFFRLLPELQGIVLSYWGVFGGFNVLLNDPIYNILNSLAALACLGLLLLVLPWRRQHLHTPSLAALLGCLLLNLMGLFLWTRTTMGSQGRLLFPSISAISTLLFLGLSQWFPERIAKGLAGVVATAGFALAVSVPFAFIAPAYPGPHSISATELAEVSNSTCVDFDGKIELLGYDIAPKEIVPGHEATVTLYWRSLTAMDEDYSIFIHLFQLDEKKIGQVDSYPAGGALPTSRWPKGAILKDRYEIAIRPDAEAPSAAYPLVGFYLLDSQDKLLAYDAQGRAIDPWLGSFKLRPDQYPRYEIPTRVDVRLGDDITLVGYGLERRSFTPGEPLPLTLYWRCDAKLAADYTIFVHIIAARGQKPVAQVDSEPKNGLYPTSFWSEGEVVQDQKILALEQTMPPGDYLLAVGMYNGATGERLPIRGEADGMNILAQITVLFP